MGAIQSQLLPNGTTWHRSCAAATGVDVFAMGQFPTTASAKNMTQSRDCVNYLNQLNQKANALIQCETHVGNQTIVLAELLTDLLMGKSSNKTDTKERTAADADNMSGSASLAAEEEPTVAPATESPSAASGSKDAVTDQDEPNRGAERGTSSAGVTLTASLAAVAAVAVTVLASTL
ncbi:unnamed protein product [Hyaloperonospora brassicae]|uniref:Elicitin n=1 Tax=Hyaloperonospora brassicae TaxID=162125 RepID=A0AAV0TFP1_HYABA|nr:unnamed protein product [Hyaloperonospora brassicae]CAI5741032.1 unnamed protein product [Hyaloperonospora brassicae]